MLEIDDPKETCMNRIQTVIVAVSLVAILSVALVKCMPIGIQQVTEIREVHGEPADITSHT